MCVIYIYISIHNTIIQENINNNVNNNGEIIVITRYYWHEH